MQKITRKFKSFQREEKREPATTYSNDYIEYGRGRDRDHDEEFISFQNDRNILLKLFPGLVFNKLKTYAVFKMHGMDIYLTENKEYEVIKRESGQIYVINNKEREGNYPSHWFKPPFKKYDFEVYAVSRTHVSGMKRDKLYRLFGETNNGYEVMDDYGVRRNFSKGDFGFPEKKEKTDKTMEHLEAFNEHQKRKFKSFQKEKQDQIDKKEEEERRKSWGTSYGTGYSGGGYGWRDQRWNDDYRKKASIVSTAKNDKKIISTTIGGQWRMPSTWVSNIVPTFGDDIEINGPVYLDDSFSFRSCHDLKINLGKTLIISSKVVLGVVGDFTNYGSLKLEDGASKDGKVQYTSLVVSGTSLSGYGSEIKTGKYTTFKTKTNTITKGGLENTPATKEIDILSNPHIDTDTKIKLEHSYALQDLFPSIVVENLPIWAICASHTLPQIRYDEDYEVLPDSSPGTPVDNITVKNERGIICSYRSNWFRLYKKYDFNLYITPTNEYGDVVKETEKGRVVITLGYNLTKGRSYKVIGSTFKGLRDCQYEILDDRGDRKSYSKLIFHLPYRLEA